MRLLALLAVLALAIPVWAANTGDWLDENGNVKNRIGPGDCRVFQWTTASTQESKFMKGGGLVLSFFLNPDDEGTSSVAATAKLYKCSGSVDEDLVDADSCREAKVFDTTGSGTPDTGVFTYSGIAQEAVSGVEIAGWFYIEPLTDAAGTGEAVMNVCAQRF